MALHCPLEERDRWQPMCAVRQSGGLDQNATESKVKEEHSRNRLICGANIRNSNANGFAQHGAGNDSNVYGQEVEVLVFYNRNKVVNYFLKQKKKRKKSFNKLTVTSPELKHVVRDESKGASVDNAKQIQRWRGTDPILDIGVKSA